MATDAASALLQLRRDRVALFPRNLFSDPAWDILLELFVADAEGRQLTGRGLCTCHDISPAAGARWLRHLSHLRLIAGGNDGGLDVPLHISAVASRSLHELFSKALQREVAYHQFTCAPAGAAPLREGALPDAFGGLL
jgi:hypothetical protein